MNIDPSRIRRLISDGIVLHAPDPLLRLSEKLIDWPVHAAMRTSPILFIHIPKNAGTSIAKQLYGGHCGHHTAMWYRSADLNLFTSKHKLALTRDPYERFLSAYKFARDGGTSSVAASFSVTQTVAELGCPLAVAEMLLRLPRKQRNHFDPVFQEQSLYLLDEAGNLLVDQIVCLEDVTGSVIVVAGIHLDFRVRENRGTSIRRAGVLEEHEMLLRERVRELYDHDYAMLERS